MIDRVLVPLDGSEMAYRALEFALSVHPDADITVLFVAGEPSPMMAKALSVTLGEDIEDSAEDLAGDIFATAHDYAAQHHIDIQTIVEVGAPGKAIVERATDFDLVVMGSHGGDLRSRLFVGNVAEQVTRHSPVPVTVVR